MHERCRDEHTCTEMLACEKDLGRNLHPLDLLGHNGETGAWNGLISTSTHERTRFVCLYRIPKIEKAKTKTAQS